MKKLKFKTNIECGGCVNAVTPFLNGSQGITDWNVDTANPDKILTINSSGITEEQVIEAVRKAGFTIEKI